MGRPDGANEAEFELTLFVPTFHVATQSRCLQRPEPRATLGRGNPNANHQSARRPRHVTRLYPNGDAPRVL